MEKQDNNEGTSAKDSLHVEEVTCSKCGRVLKSPREWITGEKGTVYCAFCYQDLLYPNINDYSKEILD